jgi:Flp pilus assembly protein TadG
MQRLTLGRSTLLHGRRRTRRGTWLHDERGASAVLFALLLVPMLGFAAIAVDIGALYAERARLQISADAAALAVAQDCARGNCGNMLATAQNLVTANAGPARAAPPVLSSRPLSVTVSGSTPQQHWFAPVLGHDSTQVSASATVGWGAPGAGIAVLPLTFSWCEFAQQTGGGLPSNTTEHTIYFTKTSNTVGCTGPSNNVVPGGFAYLDPSGRCEAASEIDGRTMSSTGNSVPSACTPADFSAWIGRTVLLPLFDEAGLTGSNAWYKVYGFAAFRITGYSLGGQYNTTPKPCGGNERCVRGYFTRFVDLSERFTYTDDGPNLGTSIVKLIR